MKTKKKRKEKREGKEIRKRCEKKEKKGLIFEFSGLCCPQNPTESSRKKGNIEYKKE